MIHYQETFYEFIEIMGVGKNDVVASSPDSYINYLNSVSRIIKKDISPKILNSEKDVLTISENIYGQRADNTVRNYCSAMRQYVSFVKRVYQKINR